MIMKVIGIIPARYGSTRLPGKPLKDILGHPMIWWVYKRVCTVEKLSEVYVATDDERIKLVCEQNKIPVIMTSNTHKTAANRLQEVSEKIEADFYLQLNGDEPLINTDAITAAIPSNVPIDIEFGTNIITEITEPTQLMDPSNIKMVFDDNMNALYMSRAPIPYPFKSLNYKYYKHVGIIGYNKKMLDFYKNSKPGRFELIEGIDTLRFLDYGKQLKLHIVPECHNLSIDTEKDLEMVIKIMKEGN
ncbi:MAG: 3-deoxy-manno-octulosonate cytidylyltransferase [Eubacterium coprostanoligenes]|uniref:3-deoxy-manno-octulosonate cytidylyltransferase n=1 Tax=Eubacterium coprostanoligenes TaxID=290054 RepID=UPI0023569CCA|nr:3-deoxy-manno-octulosonate cytidylyltransferase [Eubacterium coprostanoligenes]MCI7264081.1 3-deoxy-manno-octulosonate cytidylyltransferase [Eubacterium coprostanoligenes]